MDYLEYKVHEGKTGEYNIIKINCRIMNSNSSQLLKSEFVSYFGNKPKKSGEEKHCLNLENVAEIDTGGLSALLVFNRLNTNFGLPRVTLSGCNNKIIRALNLSQVDSFFDFVGDIKEL